MKGIFTIDEQKVGISAQKCSARIDLRSQTSRSRNRICNIQCGDIWNEDAGGQCGIEEVIDYTQTSGRELSHDSWWTIDSTGERRIGLVERSFPHICELWQDVVDCCGICTSIEEYDDSFSRRDHGSQSGPIQSVSGGCSKRWHECEIRNTC